MGPIFSRTLIALDSAQPPKGPQRACPEPSGWRLLLCGPSTVTGWGWGRAGLDGSAMEPQAVRPFGAELAFPPGRAESLLQGWCHTRAGHPATGSSRGSRHTRNAFHEHLAPQDCGDGGPRGARHGSGPGWPGCRSHVGSGCPPEPEKRTR